jgi:LAS superfamily LD-carboxypeptidase LdcB
VGGTTATGIGIPIAFMEVVGMILMGCIGNMIGRWLASSQCVVIMPLQVNGLEFSAGIDGHLGAVVGDPVSESDNFWASIFSSNYSEQQHGVWGCIVPFIADFLLPGADSGWNPSNPALPGLPTLHYSTIPVQQDSFDEFMKVKSSQASTKFNFQYYKTDSNGNGELPSKVSSTTSSQVNSSAPLVTGGAGTYAPSPHYNNEWDMYPEFYTALKNLLNFAASKHVKLTIVSGRRSDAQQTELFNEEVRKYNGDTSKARHMVAAPRSATNRGSMHELGMAADLQGDLAFAHANAAAFGLAFPMPYERWHIQLAVTPTIYGITVPFK